MLLFTSFYPVAPDALPLFLFRSPSLSFSCTGRGRGGNTGQQKSPSLPIRNSLSHTHTGKKTNAHIVCFLQLLHFFRTLRSLCFFFLSSLSFSFLLAPLFLVSPQFCIGSFWFVCLSACLSVCVSSLFTVPLLPAVLSSPCI